MTFALTIKGVQYEIDEYGRITKRKGKGYFKTFPDKDGYEKAALTIEGKTHNAFVHRLLYEAVYGEIPEGMTVDHIDDDRTNNHISNLQLLPRGENSVKGNARTWVVVYPNGDEEEVYILRKFCRDNNLHSSHLYDGKYKDWSLK